MTLIFQGNFQNMRTFSSTIDTIEERLEFVFTMRDLEHEIRHTRDQVVWYRNAIRNNNYDDHRGGIIKLAKRLEEHVIMLKGAYYTEWNNLKEEQKKYFSESPYNFGFI